MKKIITIGIVVVILNASTAFAGLTDMGIGYIAGKSGSSEGRPQPSQPVLGVVPVKCTLTGSKCIVMRGRKTTTIPVTQVCIDVGKGYKLAGFMKVGNYASIVLLLCKKD